MAKKKNTAEANNQLLGIIAVIVVAAFVVGVIIIFAKSLFSGVDADIPKGLDTATVTNAQAVTNTPAVSDEDSSEDETTTKKKKKKEETTTTAQAGMGTKTVNEYAYLREDPSPEGAEIICMSPGITVTLLSEADENGYVKATFDNAGTQLTGWVHSDYLV